MYFLLKFNTLMNKRHKIEQTTPFMDFLLNEFSEFFNSHHPKRSK